MKSDNHDEAAFDAYLRQRGVAVVPVVAWRERLRLRVKVMPAIDTADGPLNEQKGDADAATWLPPNRSYRCAYVARQVAVKVAYGLWVTQAERDAIAAVLGGCPAEPLPADRSEPAPAPAPPAPAPARYRKKAWSARAPVRHPT